MPKKRNSRGRKSAAATRKSNKGKARKSQPESPVKVAEYPVDLQGEILEQPVVEENESSEIQLDGSPIEPVASEEDQEFPDTETTDNRKQTLAKIQDHYARMLEKTQKLAENYDTTDETNVNKVEEFIQINFCAKPETEEFEESDGEIPPAKTKSSKSEKPLNENEDKWFDGNDTFGDKSNSTAEKNRENVDNSDEEAPGPSIPENSLSNSDDDDVIMTGPKRNRTNKIVEDSDEELSLSDMRINSSKSAADFHVSRKSLQNISSDSDGSDYSAGKSKKKRTTRSRFKNLIDSDSCSTDSEDEKRKKPIEKPKKKVETDAELEQRKLLERVLNEHSDQELEEITIFRNPRPIGSKLPRDSDDDSNDSTDDESCQVSKVVVNKFQEKENMPGTSSAADTADLIEYFERRYNSSSAQSKVAVNSSRNSSPMQQFGQGYGTWKKTGARQLLTYSELNWDTKKANKEEKARIKRLENKENMLNAKFPNRNDSTELLLDYDTKKAQKICVDPRIARNLKQHQIDAVRFLYDSLYGSVNDFAAQQQTGQVGSGCILAHCMGLGKTLSLIALIATASRYHQLQSRRVLILCPKSTVYNWVDEVIKWVGKTVPITLNFFEDNMTIDQKIERMELWYQKAWQQCSILFLGYESFRNLTILEKSALATNKKVMKNLDEYQQKIDKYLIDGPQLCVLDEGHIIKNLKCMINFVKPMFLGNIYEFNNLYANPIKQGQHIDSDIHDIKLMKERSYILNSVLSAFIHRRNVSLLKTFLPKKFEYCIYVGLTENQTNLYKHYLSTHPLRNETFLMPDWTALRKIWTHVRILKTSFEKALIVDRKDIEKKRLKKQYAKDLGQSVGFDDDEDERLEDSDENGDDSDENLALNNNPFSGNWWRGMIPDAEFESLFASNKLVILFEIIKKCQDRGEKLVVFSSFVMVLETLEYFLDKISKQNGDVENAGYSRFRGQWVKGLDYMRLDGNTSKSMRHQMIQKFNDSSDKRMRLFLISAKAGGMGINLTAANRCVILDCSWNPTNDSQNIFRIYRMGQKKTCFVYRLLAAGTMEEKIYSRSVTKEAMSFRVVDKKQIDRHFKMEELEELYTLTEVDFDKRPLLEEIEDPLFKEVWQKHKNQIYRYHTHDSLLDNKEESDLSEMEKKEAWEKHELMKAGKMAADEAKKGAKQKGKRSAAGKITINPGLAMLDFWTGIQEDNIEEDVNESESSSDETEGQEVCHEKSADTENQFSAPSDRSQKTNTSDISITQTDDCEDTFMNEPEEVTATVPGIFKSSQKNEVSKVTELDTTIVDIDRLFPLQTSTPIPSKQPENLQLIPSKLVPIAENEDEIETSVENMIVVSNLSPVSTFKKGNKQFMVLKKTQKPSMKVLVEKNPVEGGSIAERVSNLRNFSKRPIKEEVLRVLKKPRKN